MAETKNNKPKDPIIQRTLVLIKPDGVQRGLMGRIIQRFEDAGLKIVGGKMVWMNQEFGKKHYFDVAQRRGEAVLKNLLTFMTEGPVMALCFEGVNLNLRFQELLEETLHITHTNLLMEKV